MFEEIWKGLKGLLGLWGLIVVAVLTLISAFWLDYPGSADWSFYHNIVVASFWAIVVVLLRLAWKKLGKKNGGGEA
jgi:hypothetical protein